LSGWSMTAWWRPGRSETPTRGRSCRDPRTWTKQTANTVFICDLFCDAWSCGICGGQSGGGAGFLRVLLFPMPIFIPPIASQSPSSIIRGWFNRPVSGRLSPTPLRVCQRYLTIWSWIVGWLVNNEFELV
jgi:hypothetical protein